jgi:hypothetical protein
LHGTLQSFSEIDEQPADRRQIPSLGAMGDEFSRRTGLGLERFESTAFVESKRGSRQDAAAKSIPFNRERICQIHRSVYQNDLVKELGCSLF